MISYGKQTLDEEDFDAVAKIFKSDWLTQGPAVENFEKTFRIILDQNTHVLYPTAQPLYI